MQKACMRAEGVQEACRRAEAACRRAEGVQEACIWAESCIFG